VNLVQLRTAASKNELAWFGLLLLAFLGLLGVVVWTVTGTLTASRYLWGAGVFLAAVYYLVPPLRRPMFAGWMYAAYPLGWVMSHVLLAIVYFGVMTLVGVLMRLFNYDPLDRRFDRAASTYWIPRERNTAASQYLRQF
jgi:hypothetical protein